MNARTGAKLLFAFFCIVVTLVYIVAIAFQSPLRKEVMVLEDLGCVVSYGRRGGWRMKIPETVELNKLFESHLDELNSFGSPLTGTRKSTFVEFQHPTIPRQHYSKMEKLSGNLHVVIQRDSIPQNALVKIREKCDVVELMVRDADGDVHPITGHETAGHETGTGPINEN